MTKSILGTIEDDIKQLSLLVNYHQNIVNDAKLYNRPSEQALEELTVKYLYQLKEEKDDKSTD